MAWDFSTEPEFQEQLDWMREFVREEIWPLETVFDELGQDGFERAIAPLQEQVKERGLWAAHLPPELGGQGFGQVKLGLMHEILGTSRRTRPRVRQPGAGLRQLRAPRARRAPTDQKEQLAAAAAGRRPALGVLDDRARDAGSDPTLLQTRAVRDGDEWVINGHKWFSSNASVADFLIVMAVTDPDAQPLPARLDDHRAGRHAGREHRARRRRRWSTRTSASARSAATPRSSTRTCACPTDALLGERGRRLPARPAAARPGPHPPLHALARRLAARLRHALRARAVAATRTARCWPRSRRSRTGSPTRAAEMQAARLMTLHAAWKMDTRGRRRPRARRSR